MLRARKFIGLGIVLFLFLGFSPFLGSGKAQRPAPPIFPGGPGAGDHKLFLPFLFSLKKEPTPTPTATQRITPSTTRPPAESTPTATTRPGDPTNTPIATVTASGSGITADHTVINQFPDIPDSAIQQAEAIQTLFIHQSTGDNIKTIGLNCLKGLILGDPQYPECEGYTPGYYNWDLNWDWRHWKFYYPGDPTTDSHIKTDRFVEQVNAQYQSYAVMGMKFCYTDSSSLDFEYYRQQMEALEQAYPGKVFIWTTSALYGVDVEESPSGIYNKEILKVFNDQARAYAISQNKVFYDIADIESRDSNGNLCLSTSGYAGLCREYTDGPGGSDGGHPDAAGSVRLAQGFWWLMARVGGWGG